ncbi:neurocalcin-delta isoform X2 [Ailuropoda melanoleuca]|uniref:neurocalcin-delta isoform X2 n=1 Tax=Ailuropoda melanoleuca TaxID=9646 RepID=UPI00149427A7|nr:neurocalcin-delta isoform X2 [Ailuropoda melanoleuca]
MFSPFWRPEAQNQGVSTASPPEASGENSCLPVPAAGGCRHFWAPGCITHIPASVVTWPPLLRMSLGAADLGFSATLQFDFKRERGKEKKDSIVHVAGRGCFLPCVRSLCLRRFSRLGLWEQPASDSHKGHRTAGDKICRDTVEGSVIQGATCLRISQQHWAKTFSSCHLSVSLFHF